MNDHTMNNDHDTLAMPPEELFDLLADRATFGLDEADEARLESLLSEYRWVREDCMDEVAASLAVAFDEAVPATGETTGDMTAGVPMDVMNRIREGVHQDIDREASSDTAPLGRVDATTSASSGSGELPTGFGASAWLGWTVAAAAIALAVVFVRTDDTTSTIAPPPSSATELASWVDTRPAAVRWDWAEGFGDCDEEATGWVTFDPEAQEGYMLIKGLTPNDPRVQQYQLWIWDQDREPDPANPSPLADNVHPVDGGVFDVNAEGEAVIPIQASLVVNKPYLFAITIERPGGVAKSDKSAVPLIAGPPDGA